MPRARSTSSSRTQIARADDPVAERGRLVADYEAEFDHPYVAASRGWIDDVILPSETRPRLIGALEMLARQARDEPPQEARQHPAVSGGGEGTRRRVFAQRRRHARAVSVAGREPALRAGARRQPGRDRAADHPGLPRDGDGGSRRLLRRRRDRRARPCRRSCGPAGPGARGGELSPDRRRRRRRRWPPVPRPSTRDTASCPSARRSPRQSRRLASRGSGRRRRRSQPSATSLQRVARRATPTCPHVPGTLEPAPVDRPDEMDAILASARSIGFPLLVKAAAGGGGRGMRRVVGGAGAPGRAHRRGSREAAATFGDGSVYLEREIMPGPPHRGPAPGRRRGRRRRDRRA